MNRPTVFLLLVAALLCVCAIVFSFWPFVPIAIALLVLYGHTTSGMVVALVADLLFGAPLGLLGYLHFPFLLFALVCVLLRQLSLRLVLERSGLDAI